MPDVIYQRHSLQGYTALVSDVDYARVVAAGPLYVKYGKGQPTQLQLPFD
jgi:hypothetical protein